MTIECAGKLSEWSMAAASCDEQGRAAERRTRRLRCRFAVDSGKAQLTTSSEEGFAVAEDGNPSNNSINNANKVVAATNAGVRSDDLTFNDGSVTLRQSAFDNGKCDVIANLANQVLRADRNKEVTLSVETLHRLLISSSLHGAVRPLIHSNNRTQSKYSVISGSSDLENQLHEADNAARQCCGEHSMNYSTTDYSNDSTAQQNLEGSQSSTYANSLKKCKSLMNVNNMTSGHGEHFLTPQSELTADCVTKLSPGRRVRGHHNMACDLIRMEKLPREDSKLLHKTPHKLAISNKSSILGHRGPDPPTNVTLAVSGRSSLLVTFDRPAHSAEITHFLVEWSYFENFSRIVGSHAISEISRNLILEICDLEPGNRYYVRVRAGSMYGFSIPITSSPSCATPSNWRDFEECTARNDGKRQIFDHLYETLQGLNTDKAASTIMNHVETSSSKVRKTIKNLFTSGVKLQKTLKRGLYIATLIHYEGRLLVTNDDVIPAVQVDNEHPMSGVHNGELYWLMKVSSLWFDLKSIQEKLFKCTSSSVSQFRSRLLQGILQLQSAVGLHDLGQFHFVPSFNAATESTVFVAVRSLSDIKAVDTSRGLHWIALSKLVSRRSSIKQEVTSTTDDDGWQCLLDSAHDMVVNRCLGVQVLSRGLYVSYLKLSCGSGLMKDSVNVLVPRHQPNILPYVKVRDNPNVTSEEWRWLVNEKLQANSLWIRPLRRQPTETQQVFENQLRSACDRLLMDIGDGELDECRLYDAEILEVNADVSFIIVLPPSERVCESPMDEHGTNHQWDSSDSYCSVPVQAFEILHLQAYQPEMTRRYCQLSTTVDVQLSLMQHEFRQALTTEEITRLKGQVDHLNQLRNDANDTWKSVRWLPDVTSYARGRGSNSMTSFNSSLQSPDLHLGSSSLLANGLPLSALFGPVKPVPGVGRRSRKAVQSDKSRTFNLDSWCQKSQSTSKTVVRGSVVGSDSDYHSDISVECLTNSLHYQPVLL